MQGKIAQEKKANRIMNLVIIIVLFLVIILVIVGLIPFFQSQKIVSRGSMEEYSKAFISDYNQYLSFYLPDTYQYFWFYSNNNEVTTVASSIQGAAVWIQPSNSITTYNNIFTNERADAKLFNVNPSSGVAIVPFGDTFGIIENSSVINTSLVSPQGNNTVIVRDCSVNSIAYHFVILKGSNDLNYWKITNAKLDAKELFEIDLVHALSNSEAVREHYAESELNTLLLNVIKKWHNQLYNSSSINYSLDQKEYDLNQIEEIAKNKYGITDNDFINRTLNYLENVNLPSPTPIPTPEKTILGVSYTDSWVYATGFIFYFIFLYGLYLVIKSKQKIHSEEMWHFLETYGLELTLGAGGIGLFVADLPFGSSYLPLQIIYVSICSIVGIFTIDKKKESIYRKLTTLRFLRSKTDKTAKKNPN